MKTCREYETLISAFLDGELSEGERAEVAEHLASCPTCQRYFDDLVAIHDAFDQVEEASVPEDFTAQVMAQVRQTPQAESRKIIPFPRWKRWTALAACCAIVALGLWGVRQRGLVESTSQTVLARSGPSMARDADAPADGEFVTTDDAPMALMMDKESEALPEEAPAPLPAEGSSEDRKYYRDAADGTSGSLPEREEYAMDAEEDGGYFENDALAPEPAQALPAPAAADQAEPRSGIIAASGETVRTWVENELDLEWEPGRTYLLTEEEYAGLLDALTAAGEDFRLEPGEGCWLLAE